MHARLTIYEDVDLELAGKVEAWMESQERDPFADLPGYSGSITLVDRDNARLVGIGFYETAGHVEEAEAVLAGLLADAADAVPEDVRAALDMRPDTVGVYEVLGRD